MAGYDPDASVSAFERMFERDKDELRGMGVPIQTIADAHGEVQGYVVDNDEYATRDLELSAEEIAVLNLAAQLWDDAVLESAALTAVRKLESTIDEDPPPATTTFGVLTARDAALLPLLRAVRDGRAVRFDYRKPGDAHEETRTVEPWAVRSKGGRWYVVGWDTERDEQRVFRISRIVGSVQLTAVEVSTRPNSRDDVWHSESDDDVTMEVVIPAGVGAELRRLPDCSTQDSTTFTITEGRQQLLTLLWRADPRVRVRAPEDLVAEYRAGLEKIAQDHT